MSNTQQEEAEEQNRLLQQQADAIAAENAKTQPLRDLQLQNALAAEGKIAEARAGTLPITGSTERDFKIAEKQLNERFRKAGQTGSTAHIQALNDFRTKKAESLSAIREGRLTNLSQRTTAANERLASSLAGSRTSSRNITDVLGSKRISPVGFSRSIAVGALKVGGDALSSSSQFQNTLGGAASNIFGSIGRSAPVRAGKSLLGAIFGVKSKPPSS